MTATPFPHLPPGSARAAPVMATERLTLRPMNLGDWPAYRDVMVSPRAIHMGGPFGPNAAWGHFCADHAGWQLVGAGALAIDAADGTTVGQVVLNSIPAFPELELGWMLHDGQEGHGYATEAAAAFRDWIVSEIAPPSLVSYVSPDNAGSVAVATRLGARRDDDAPRPAPDDLVFRHLDSDGTPTGFRRDSDTANREGGGA